MYCSSDQVDKGMSKHNEEPQKRKPSNFSQTYHRAGRASNDVDARTLLLVHYNYAINRKCNIDLHQRR